MSSKFASLFGVEQADIDQMNSIDGSGCPGGSPYATPLSGAFNRDGNFLETVISPNQLRPMEIRRPRSVTAAGLQLSQNNQLLQ
jgi:hypothetical protein